jgi:predicted RNA-binding Zn ribbon-like protein
VVSLAEQAFRGWAVENQVPADIALVYDFVNTLDERVFGELTGAEALPDAAALTRWLRSRGLLARGQRASAADLELALALRGTLRAAARANLTGVVDRSTADPFAALASKLPMHASLDSSGRLGLAPASSGVPGALTRILADAVTASARGDTWPRLKMCAAPDCRWLFYDHAKPRTGRWCSTDVCGNRMKTRAYRARRRSASHDPSPDRHNEGQREHGGGTGTS